MHVHVQSTPFGLQQVWDIDTPKRKSGYLLPSQQLNLEDHATSDIHLLGLFLYGGFRLSGTEWWATEY